MLLNPWEPDTAPPWKSFTGSLLYAPSLAAGSHKADAPAPSGPAERGFGAHSPQEGNSHPRFFPVIKKEGGAWGEGEEVLAAPEWQGTVWMRVMQLASLLHLLSWGCCASYGSRHWTDQPEAASRPGVWCPCHGCPVGVGPNSSELTSRRSAAGQRHRRELATGRQ